TLDSSVKRCVEGGRRNRNQQSTKPCKRGGNRYIVEVAIAGKVPMIAKGPQHKSLALRVQITINKYRIAIDLEEYCPQIGGDREVLKFASGKSLDIAEAKVESNWCETHGTLLLNQESPAGLQLRRQKAPPTIVSSYMLYWRATSIGIRS